MYFCEVAPNGKIISSGSCPGNDCSRQAELPNLAVPATSLMEGKTTYYDFNLAEYADRPVMPITVSGTGSVLDTLVISGVPVGAEIYWPDESQPDSELADGNDITFSSLEPGDYELRFVLFPYQDEIVTCQVG